MFDENGNICLLIKFDTWYDFEKGLWMPLQENGPEGVPGGDFWRQTLLLVFGG